jgi:hypothetical protein
MWQTFSRPGVGIDVDEQVIACQPALATSGPTAIAARLMLRLAKPADTRAFRVRTPSPSLEEHQVPDEVTVGARLGREDEG